MQRAIARIKAESKEGRHATIISPIENSAFDNGNDSLSSGHFKDCNYGDIVTFDWELSNSGSRLVKNVNVIESELELRDALTAFCNMVWMESRFVMSASEKCWDSD